MTTTMRPHPGEGVVPKTSGAGDVDLDPGEFVARSGEALYRYAYVLTGNRADAQDLVQNALLKALRHWGRVASADRPEAYVRRIVTTTFLSSRTRRATSETPVDTSSPGLDHLVPPAADHATAIARADELARLVRDLAPRMRAVVVLRYYLDLDDATIAGDLGISRVAVRSTASRALAALRCRLAESSAPGHSDPDARP